MTVRSAWLLLSLLVAVHVLSAEAAEPPFVNATFTAEGRTGTYCTQPKNAVRAWRLKASAKESYSCLKHPKQDGHWTMLNAYRSGGSKGTHWKYSTGPDDDKCLENWTYYGKDGVWVVEHVKGRVTRKGDPAKRNWCATPVAQIKKKTKTEPAGVEGNQWAFCYCTDKPPVQQPRELAACGSCVSILDT